MHDVLIVGAGPVGSYLGGKLSSLGHKVLLLEEHPVIGLPICCTGIIGKECVENFLIPSSVIIRSFNSATVFSPSGKPLKVKKESPQAYIVNRTAFDQALAHMAEKQGAEFLLETKAKGYSINDSFVQLEAEYKEKAFPIKGKVLVLACGFGSSLTQRMGRIKEYIFGVQAEVEVEDVDEVEIYTGEGIAPGSFAWLVPSFQGKGFAGLLSTNPSFYLKSFLSHLYKEGKIKSHSEPQFGLIPLQPLPRTYEERVIAVGEAAGQVKPITGGGIYYGLIASDIAASILHQALIQDNLSASFLSQYQREWKRRLGKEIRIGRWARRLYQNLGDKQLESAFHFLNSSGIIEEFIKAEDFSFDWHSRIILKALKERTLTKLWEILKIPLKK